METKKIKLSVLDQSPIRKGETAVQALQETTRLAQLTDRLGYTRFWVSEHHNFESLAGSSPEILVAHLANQTKRMRVGSGGIMLPNHSALKMAENFRLLEALFPGKIDMGIGRAPGTDRLTASLLNPTNTFNPQDFLDQIRDIDMFFRNVRDKGTLYERVIAIPKINTIPQRWMLTSSGESALLAARSGMAVSFAHFISPAGVYASAKYREQFKPSADLKKPTANVAIFAFCNENPEKVHRIQALIDYQFIQLERGILNSSFDFDDVKDERYSSFEQRRILANRQRLLFGTPKDVKPRLYALAKEYGVDEVMLVTYTESKEDKQHSYELFAEMAGLHKDDDDKYY